MNAPVRFDKPAPDTAEMRQALELMFGPDAVVELRSFPRGRGKRTDAGYFDREHRDELLKQAERLNRAGANIYVAMNRIDPQLLGRYANRIEEYAQATTADHNILRRTWLLVDFDPKRPKDTAATDEQLEMAKEQAFQCAEQLAAAGWPEPLTVMSGNGVHLLYRIDLPNDDASRDLVNATLEALAKRFDSAAVGLDKTCYNAARIVKLPGTVSTKGDNTPALPWRLSHFLSMPDTIGTVTEDELRALLPKGQPREQDQVPPARLIQPATPGKSFDLETFLSRLGIEYDKDVHGGRERFKLRRCPFNEDHGKGEAAIFRAADGKLGFKCQHNGCANKRWSDVRALVDGPPGQRTTRNATGQPVVVVAAAGDGEVSISDFRAYMPMHQYIFTPSRELWPASSVNARVGPLMVGDEAIKASEWLDKNRPVEQMLWAPGEPMLISGRLISNGGWIPRADCTTFNLYIPPEVQDGDASKAQRWLDHVRRVYPADAEHLIKWLAHRVQRPGEKINHALVLGGLQGIGKDTLLEPVKYAIGPWNFHEVSPVNLLGRFNGFVKSVILRVSEARDLGDVDRYSFYDHMKVYTASPPDVLRCDEKNIREHAVMNVCGVIITSNHKQDGIYLPADDRRHYVAWSDLDRSKFDAEYWPGIYRWFAHEGNRHVAAYLAQLDLSDFDPKAPPPQSAAFWDIVDANRAPEDAELADLLDSLGNPAAVTLQRLLDQSAGSFQEWLTDRRNRRQIPHRLESAGYVPVRNPTADSGLWVVSKRRATIYAKSALSVRDRLAAASKLTG